MSDVSVEIDESGLVAILEIRRGPNNFFDVDLIGDLADALDTLASGAVRAVVLCSEGKHFCAGADFSGASGAPRREGAPHLYDVAIRLFEQPLPIVAAVQGAAIGGGLGLALAADFRVATPDSRFAANFALLGFHHGFGLTVTLPLVVGHQAAIDLLYTGRRIDGSTARELGLCDILVGADELRQRAAAYASEIAAAGPLADASDPPDDARTSRRAAARGDGTRARRAGSIAAHRRLPRRGQCGARTTTSALRRELTHGATSGGSTSRPGVAPAARAARSAR